jgi:hypothetical protein
VTCVWRRHPFWHALHENRASWHRAASNAHDSSSVSATGLLSLGLHPDLVAIVPTDVELPWKLLPPRRPTAEVALAKLQKLQSFPGASIDYPLSLSPKREKRRGSAPRVAEESGAIPDHQSVVIFACGARHGGKRTHRDIPAALSAAGSSQGGGAALHAAAINPQSLVAGDAMLNHGYAFEGLSWARAQLRVFKLEKVWRQSDAEFVAALNELRDGERRGPMLRGVLNKTRRPLVDDGSGIIPTLLFPINRNVDMHNRLELSKLRGPEFAFMAHRTLKPEVTVPNTPEQFALQKDQVLCAYCVVL